MLRLTPCWAPACCWHRLPQQLILVLHAGKGRQAGQSEQGPHGDTSSFQGRSPPTVSTLGKAAGGGGRPGGAPGMDEQGGDPKK